MNRQTLLVFFKWLLVLIAGLVVLLGIGIWYLSTGPVSLTFLTPFVERVLESEDEAYTIQVQDTVLRWAGWRRALDVRAQNVTIKSNDGSLEAILPELSVGLSLSSLARGSIVPTSLAIFKPRLSANRSLEGKFFFGSLSAEIPSSGFNLIVERLISELLGSRELDRPLSNLRRVNIFEADITLDDKFLGKLWHAPRTNLELQRSSDGLSVEADVTLDVGGESSRITGELSYERLEERVFLAVRFKDLNPSLISDSTPQLKLFSSVNTPVSGSLEMQLRAGGKVDSVVFDLDSARGGLAGEFSWADDRSNFFGVMQLQRLEAFGFVEQIPQFAPLASIKTPLDGRVEFEVDKDGQLGAVKFDVNSGPGELEFLAHYPNPIEVSSMHISGSMVGNFKNLDIAEATIDFGGPITTLKASTTRVHDAVELKLKGSVKNLPINLIGTYWPPQIAPVQRNWLTTNVVGGTVSEAQLSMTVGLVGDTFDKIEFKLVSGTLDVKNSSVRISDLLSPITDVNAVTSFNAQRVRLDVSGAQMSDIQVKQAKIDIANLDSDAARATIDMYVKGPVSKVFSAFEHGFGDSGGVGKLSVQGLSGQMDVRIKLELPLFNKSAQTGVEIEVDGKILNVEMDKTSFGYVLTSSELDIRFDSKKLEAFGEVYLNGVPTLLNWRMFLSPASEIKKHIDVSGRLDDHQRESVGMIPIPFLTGPINLSINYREYNNGHKVLVFDGDVTPATVNIDLIDWRKKSQDQGKLELVINTMADGSVEIEDFRFSSGDMYVAAKIVPKADFTKIYRIEFDQLRYGVNDISGVVDALPEGGYRILLNGTMLDVAPLLQKRRVPEVPYAREKEKAPVIIQANIDEITDGPERRLTNVKVNARYDGHDWQAFIIDAEVGGGGSLDFKYQPIELGYSLQITSNNAGQALKSLNWTDRAQNGALVVNGTRASLHEPMVGNFKVTDYRLIDAPVLARLLQVASLTGILSALGQRGGLEFVTLDGNYSYLLGSLEINEARTYGSSIGITMEGNFDFEADTVDIRGTVVPAYTINRVLGVIPVVGRLLTGGKDEGVFAATYNVKGDIENPTITANPLLALAPGFLRSLLGNLGQGRQDGELEDSQVQDEITEENGGEASDE